ncbi:MAG: histidine kinase [Bacteroidetes bacterium OLB11]|nr:MAG: histidine kinase [Bacteroidetes bacterium OLB11]
MKFTIAYIFLFFYVIAAIIFWGYSLNRQGILISNLEKEKMLILSKYDKNIQLQQELDKIETKKERRISQFWGEGATFIIIIIIAAGVVYISYYKQRKLAKLQHNFMLSITHELKTPLAGIKLNLQTLEKRKLDETTQTKLVGYSIVEANRLNDLCNNILIATQLEKMKEVIYTDDVSLNQILNEVVDEKKRSHHHVNIQFNQLLEDKIIQGDLTLWKLVFSNLIENAIKYSPKDEAIIIDMKNENNKTSISIKDCGAGIADEEKEKNI